jgi:hypothetical protein
VRHNSRPVRQQNSDNVHFPRPFAQGTRPRSDPSQNFHRDIETLLTLWGCCTCSHGNGPRITGIVGKTTGGVRRLRERVVENDDQSDGGH